MTQLDTFSEARAPDQAAGHVPLDHLWYLAEAAQRLRTGQNQVRGLLASKALHGTKVAATWRISERAIREFLGEPLPDAPAPAAGAPPAPAPPPSANAVPFAVAGELTPEAAELVAGGLLRWAAQQRAAAHTPPTSPPPTPTGGR